MAFSNEYVCPSGLVSAIGEGPGLNVGRRHCRLSLSTTVQAVLWPPIVTVVPDTNPLPLIVTEVPDATSTGETLPTASGMTLSL